MNREKLLSLYYHIYIYHLWYNYSFNLISSGQLNNGHKNYSILLFCYYFNIILLGILKQPLIYSLCTGQLVCFLLLCLAALSSESSQVSEMRSECRSLFVFAFVKQAFLLCKRVLGSFNCILT